MKSYIWLDFRFEKQQKHSMNLDSTKHRNRLKKENLKLLRDILSHYGWDFCYQIETKLISKSEKENQKEWAVLNLKQAFRSLPEFINEKEYFETKLADLDEILDKTLNPKNVFGPSLESVRLVSEINNEKHLLANFKEGKPLRRIFEAAIASNYHFIESVKIQDFYSIKDVSIEGLSKSKEIYFVGENGDGKTLLLAGMLLAFSGNFVLEKFKAENVGAALDLLKHSESPNQTANDDFGTSYSQNTKYALKNLFAYGGNRALCTSDNHDASGFMSLFTDRCELVHPNKLLTGSLFNAFDKQTEFIRFVGDDAPRPSLVPLDFLQDFFHDLLDKKVRIDVRLYGGTTYDEKGAKIKFEQLSDGFKNILIWVSDLIYRLQMDQPMVGDLSKFKGVVMLDEIELHLHPSWQNNLVQKLRKYFPLIQFIFTTHSPSIIQGASEDAIIYRVYRDAETGETKVSEPYFKRDMTHMMYNTLMTSPLFGLETARISPETENPDTSDSFLASRVEAAVKEALATQKEGGKSFISKEDIDALIKEVLDKELSK